MQDIIIFVIVLGTLILIHEFGHFIVARKKQVRVERFSIGFGPKIFSFKGKETEYCLSLIPLGGYVKMAGDEDQDFEGKPDEFLSKPVGSRAAIIFAGSAFNYLLALVLFCLLFVIGSPVLTPRVGSVSEDYPAFKAGLREGDLILSIDQKKVSYWDEITEFIQSSQNEEVMVKVLRDGENLSFMLKPVVEERQDIFGETERSLLIGIGPAQEIIYVKYPLFQAVYQGTKAIISQTATMLKVIWYLIAGRMDIRQTLAGPVGIFVITKEVAGLGLRALLKLVSVLSVNLAIVNLLPIPVLDGGHLLFLGIEKIKKRPVSQKTMELATGIGLAALLVLIVFIFYNDFVNFNIIEKIQNLWRAR